MTSKKIAALEDYLILCDLLDDDELMVINFIHEKTKTKRSKLRNAIYFSNFDKIIDEIRFCLDLKYDHFVIFKTFRG